MSASQRAARPSKKRSPSAAEDRLAALRRRLAKAIPKPECELDHENAWQLLIATILSAQSTDRTVNRVTPELFRRYPDAPALARARRPTLEKLVKSTGFFRNKAKAIHEVSKILARDHEGVVPRDMEALVALPGVARKTANLVLGTAHGIPSGIVVDTHVARVAQRLELTREKNPEKIERDLCTAFPKRSWVDAGHRLLLHGRYVCTAKKPSCAACPVNELCSVAEAGPVGPWGLRADREARRVAARGAEAGLFE